jgi:hypothetical protein
MADLSNLLGAVYGDSAETGRDPDGPPVPVEPAAAERGPSVPDWADDEHLDAAFAQWKPGPSAEAHDIERALVADEPFADEPFADEPFADEPFATKPLADDLAAALSEALTASDPDDDRDVAVADPDIADRHTADPHAMDDDDDDDDADDADEDAEVLPFQRRRDAAAELSATAGPLPLAPPPPIDVVPEEHHDEPVTAPITAAGPVVPRNWDRSDDDILPARRRGFLSLSLRRG